MSTKATLERTTFTTSRLLEFFTEKELTMQIGYEKDHWPIALLKELLDNALDACETAGIAPTITVTVEPDVLTVHDNGPGLPAATLERSLDYLVRVSDKAHYVSPTRGQLGNALKCVWAAPYVADGEQGRVEVITGGIVHSIDVRLDRIAQAPILTHTPSPDSVVKTGTMITIPWPEIASYLTRGRNADFYNACDLLRRYAVFNPHATFHYVDEGQHTDFPATEPSWQKWLPTDPTSPHWYTVERLRALLAAYLAEEAKPDSRPRTVREFVAEFQGLKGTAKQKAVTEAAGLSGALLRDLVAGQDLAEERVRALLEAMQRESREVKPVALGVLGEAHLTQCLVRDYGVEEDSVKYKRIADSTREGVPFVLEAAFGWHTERGRTREKVLGLNFAPSLGTPFRDLKLGEARVDSYDPVVVIVHLTSPRLDFTDRGKGTLTLAPVLQSTLDEAVKSVTKHWTALKRQADRQERVRERDIEHYLKAQRRHYLSVKEAAYRVMEQAYMAAGGADGLPANARQIMYAARPHVLELTGDKLWKNSAYFTQHLVPDFMAEYPGLTKYWDVVFDDRGHFTEPHTGRQLGVGTLAVRNYVRSWHDTVTDDDESFVISHEVETSGPRNRYKFVLFVEKEGFNPLLEKAQIAERFDLAIMSTKGMSVTAARQLVEDLTAAGVTILVLHDFDKAGFSIVHTLRSDTRRFKYRTPPQVVDLGLRLTDAQAMQLQSEPVEYDSEKDPRVNLHESGATVEECDFLVQRRTAGGWMGQRVELNAMTSRQLIDWLEAKLIAAGVEKVVPDKATLEKAYKRAVRQAAVQKAIDEALQNFDEDSAIDIPDDLAERVREAITGTATSWDMALWGMVREPEENEEEEAA